MILLQKTYIYQIGKETSIKQIQEKPSHGHSVESTIEPSTKSPQSRCLQFRHMWVKVQDSI